MADPVRREKILARQAAQKRAAYVSVPRGTRLCGLCKAPHHANGLCDGCAIRVGARQRSRRRGVCVECGSAWEKDYKSSSELCLDCIPKFASLVKVDPRKINNAARRRASQFGGAVGDVDVAALFEACGWVCWLCNESVDPDLPFQHPLAATLEHKVPLSRGGGHVPENCALAHRICNARKGISLVV